jgi:hypothetical protein
MAPGFSYFIARRFCVYQPVLLPIHLLGEPTHTHSRGGWGLLEEREVVRLAGLVLRVDLATEGHDVPVHTGNRL